MITHETTTLRRIRLLGVPIDIINPDSLDECLVEMLHADGYHQIVFLRTLDLMRARRNPELLACLENAAMVIPVSKGLQAAAKKLKLGIPQRFSPFDFTIRLLNVLEAKRGNYYLLGDVQPFLNRTEQNLRHTFPGAQALGRFGGGFGRSMEKNVRIAISKAAPNLLLLGSGLAGKNLWVYRRRRSFPRGVQLYCEECFEYFTGRKKRPNKVSFRKGRDYHREGLKHPWRVFRFPIYLGFQFLVLWERATKQV